jgi:hypothetical protein
MSARIRQVEHIEGNFSTHIAVELETEISQRLDGISDSAVTLLRNKTGEEPAVESKYHLSLSRHVFLRPHMIDLFVKRIIEAFKSQEQVFIFLKRELKIYLNDNKNTAFISVPVDLGRSPVCIDLIRKVDSVLDKFDLPCYYENPSPHVSLACSCRTNGFEEFEPIQTVGGLDSVLNDLRIDVTQISVFIGKQIYRIPLNR